MQKHRIILIRGLSGSGKTRHAHTLMGSEKNRAMVAADDFFMVDGEYRFDPTKLPEAHAWCSQQVLFHMSCKRDLIVVHNTFTMAWEADAYFQFAGIHEYEVDVVSIYDGGCTDEELSRRNSHSVPVRAIRAQRERWEDNIYPTNWREER